MTTAASQVAASQQRTRIPDDVLMEFEEFSDDELAYMAEHSERVYRVKNRDGKLEDKGRWRVFAGWELEYREAMRVEVFFDDGAVELTTREDGKKHVKRIVREPGVRRRKG